MQAEGISLKRRLGLLVVAVFLASTVPAQAANNLGRFCERNKETQSQQRQCCENRADNNREENRCIDYVRSH
jgi:hypothetical protein